MPDPARLALERALADVRAARAPLDAAEAQLVAALGHGGTDPLVPLKQAAHEMGLDVEAARKRARRGQGEKVQGRLYFRRSFVETYRALMST